MRINIKGPILIVSSVILVFVGAVLINNVISEFKNDKSNPNIEKFKTSKVDSIFCGYWSTYGITQSKHVFELGVTNEKKLESISTKPVIKQDIMNIKKVVSGKVFNLYLKEDKTLYMEEFYDKIDKTSKPSKYEPKTVLEALTDVKDIACYASNIVIMKEDGSVFEYDIRYRSYPYLVDGLSDVVKIDSGIDFGIALKNDGTVWKWKNEKDIASTDEQPAKVLPKKIENLANIKEISAGKLHFLAIDSNGKVFSCGGNGNGQLGDGTTIYREKAVEISGINNAFKIVSGDEHSIAVEKDGTVWTWGGNYAGQLGDGTSSARANAKKIAQIQNVKDVISRYNHSFITTYNDEIWGWGENRFGQLGDGSLISLKKIKKINFIVKYKEINTENQKSSINNKEKALALSSDQKPASLDSEEDLFNMQWALDNREQYIRGRQGIKGVDLNVLNAWNITKGSENAPIGILDTGIDITNNEIKESIYINKAEIPGNYIDDDKNGYIDDVYGWDFVNGDNTVYDDENLDAHGTSIAGVISAKDDKKGITGIAPGTKILPLKFIGGGSGDIDDFIKAVDYAISRRVSILNCSFGIPVKTLALEKTISNNRKFLFVCAAGSDKTLKEVWYPAALNYSNVVSVAPIDNKGALSEQSTYEGNVNVAAPGKDILTIYPNNRYVFASGSSYSCGYVSGIAALIKSYRSNILAEDIAYSIINTSTRLRNTKIGLANAYSSLKYMD